MTANNIQVAGVVLQNQDGEYLLVQEKISIAYGLWNLPAGHVDDGETLQQAAVREAEEETGFSVALTDMEVLVSESNKLGTRQLNSFKAHITGGKLAPQLDELLDAKWFSFDEVEQLSKMGKLRDPWVLASIKKSQDR